MILRKKDVYTHRSLESGGAAQHAMWGYKGQQRGRGREGETRARAFTVVSAEGTDAVG